MTQSDEQAPAGAAGQRTERQALIELAQETQSDGWHRRDYTVTHTLQTSVFGFALSVLSNDERVLAAARLALGWFSAGRQRRRARPLSLQLFVRPAGRDPADALPLPDSALLPFTYDAHGDRAAIDFGPHGHCALNLAAGEATAFMSSALAGRANDVARFVVSTSLLILMTRRGMVQWHAATVVRGRRAFMLIGVDNRGKSTTALALLQAGYQLLGESVTYTRRRPKSFEIMAFPVGYLQVRAGGLALFPALKERALPVVSDDGDKWRLDLREIFPNALRDGVPSALHEGRPSALHEGRLATSHLTLLFVGVGDGAQTTLRRLAAAEALRRAIPACSLWEEQDALTGIIDEATALVERVPAYEMLVGPDLDSVVAAVDSLR